MKRICLFLTGLLALSTGCHLLDDENLPTAAQVPAFPGKEWLKVANPETYGWLAQALNEARLYAESIKSESVMVIDDGRLVAAWGNTDKKYYVASVRKSFLSVMYGFYAGKSISLSATLGEYNINDKNPTLNAPELKVTVKDLLTSSSGVYHKAAAADNNGELPLRNSAQPGSTFFYNNWDFNALGTIFEQRTGAKIYEQFNQRIAQPVGMQDFNWQKDGRFDYSDYSDHPAYHFDMTARDMARFGVLMMNKGNWNGQQVVPADWLTQSTSPQIAVPESYGGGSYGYMWWVHDSGKLAEAGLSKQAFSAQGTWSQLILVDPTRKLVIIHRGLNRTIPGDKILSLLKKILAAKK